MPTKAQLSVFFIIAIVIVAAFVAVTFISKEDTKTEIPTNDFSISFQSYVENCLRAVGEQAIYENSLQGGYYSLPEQTLPFFLAYVPYYWYNKTNLMPSKETMEFELAYYVYDHIAQCLNNFEPFEQQGYQITANNEPIVAASVLNGKVSFAFDYFVEISKGESKKTFSGFNTDVPIDLLRATGYVAQIMEEQEKYPNESPISFITLLAEQNNFSFEIVDENESDAVYGLIFDVPGKQPLVYGFAAHYDWSNNK